MIGGLIATVLGFFFGFGTAAIMAASKIVKLESLVITLKHELRSRKY